MKKFIALILVTMMIIVGTGAASPRAVDQEDLIWELENEGFTRRGDVWTLEEYGDDNLEWIVAWYDMVDNYGVMTIYGPSDEYSKPVYVTALYKVAWDYEECEFVITDVLEVRR